MPSWLARRRVASSLLVCLFTFSGALAVACGTFSGTNEDVPSEASALADASVDGASGDGLAPGIFADSGGTSFACASFDAALCVDFDEVDAMPANATIFAVGGGEATGAAQEHAISPPNSFHGVLPDSDAAAGTLVPGAAVLEGTMAPGDSVLHCELDLYTEALSGSAVVLELTTRTAYPLLIRAAGNTYRVAMDGTGLSFDAGPIAFNAYEHLTLEFNTVADGGAGAVRVTMGASLVPLTIPASALTPITLDVGLPTQDLSSAADSVYIDNVWCRQ